MTETMKGTTPSRDKDHDSRFATRFVKHVRIRMPDGVSLCADMVLPEGDGPVPAVFDYYPYRKDDLSAYGLRRHVYLAEQGYAALRVDVRGTGSSEGTAVDEYTLQEQLDGVQIIAWLARQPWCNGNVGMFGTSYGGFNALQVAMHRPPALKAIVPMYFTDNRYTDDCHYKGGTLQMLYDMATYGLSMVVENAMPPYPEACGPDWAETWKGHLEAEPWLLNWLENQTFNDYWKHGSLCEDYGAIACATFLIGGWRDGYTNCNLRTFRHLRAPRKLLIGPWLHAQPDSGVPGPQVDHLYEMVRFFDHWLKGIDNGVMDEPPITLYVQKFDEPAARRKHTSGYWRHELSWPLARSREDVWYLGPIGDLGQSPEQGRLRFDYYPATGTTFPMFSAAAPYLLPVDQRLEAPAPLQWTSKPLADPVEIVGRPEASLRLAVSTEIATAVVRLLDVAPDGTAALVTKGVLNLTHRDSHESPAPLEPGRPYTVTVPLDATAWLFEPGHRLGVSLAGADFPNSWPSPRLYRAELELGEETRLMLPVTPAQDPRLPAPELPSPPAARPLVDSQEQPPVWRVSRDQIARRVTVTLSTGGRTYLKDGSRFSSETDTQAAVSEQDPARASVKSTHAVTLHWPEQTIEVRARGQIASTESALHVTIMLTITVEGTQTHERQWTRTIPRELL